MTTGKINYRKEAREDFKNNAAFDNAIWKAFQKVKAKIVYENAVRKYLRERLR